MPLRCFDPIANASVQSFDLDDAHWRALERENRRARHLRMPCCAAPVTLKISRLGTRFFAHKARSECTTAPETEAHLRLKSITVEVAQANGWRAETEVSGVCPLGEAWKADVLAHKGNARVAIEIQWSSQTDEETRRRQARYERSGVRGLWLLRQKQFPVEKDVPAVRIAGTPQEGFLAHVQTGQRAGEGEQNLSIEDFLHAALNKRFLFGMPPDADARVAILAGTMSCWNCGAATRLVTRVHVTFGPHLHQFRVDELGAYPDLFEIVHGHLPPDREIGKIKARFSRTVGHAYLSNGCFHCDALIGSHYEHEAWHTQEEVCAFDIRITDRWREALLRGDQDRNGWGVYAAP